ncbi:putative glycolipid-binding domain-containing protein [Microbacterium arborescens]|uniref:putative glycolipid-binding domain-containing protein n=1 Tax=Microbacterium arborescens TaxID=33883 RepID=UPI003C790D45
MRTTRITWTSIGSVETIERCTTEYSDDGTRIVGEVDGAIDIDITATPATNALPIRRLKLTVGGHADVEVAWVQVPSLDVGLGRQRYTRVGPRAYCFESRDRDFRRTITVDDDGFVLSYPGLFERVTGS